MECIAPRQAQVKEEGSELPQGQASSAGSKVGARVHTPALAPGLDLIGILEWRGVHAPPL